jgi:capsular polysaccharide biosynthesis protein
LHPGLNETVPRDAVVYVHRDPAEIGSVSNWYTLIGRLNSTATARGLDFIVHKGEGSFRDQIELFKRAVAVVGPHGAGLANILFCEQTTAVIELRSEPKAVRSLGSSFKRKSKGGRHYIAREEGWIGRYRER